MASASWRYKRLFVRRLYKQATDKSTTLLALLDAAAESRMSETENGKVLIATDGNRHHATFQLPSDFTPMDAAELVSEMYDRYEEAKQKLKDDGTSSPTDLQIRNEMLDKLDGGPSTIAGDFWNIRMEQTVEADA